MNKTAKEYVERMGYMPCYKFPELIGEDEEFEYYKFRVPRHYIRMHISEGGVWPDYCETEEEDTRDESVVLGVIFYPIYTGVEFIDEDADFLYYKVRVPKAFLDSPILESNMKYRILYETKSFKLETPEEKAQRESEDIECAKIPKAGESMPDRNDLNAVKKVKETKTLLYEAVFECYNSDCGGITEVGSDLWELIHARSCANCGNTKLKLKSCKSIVEEEE